MNKANLFGILISVVISSSAFAAGEFKPFIGTYKLKDQPRIIKTNISYCNWLNIKQMTGLVIGTLNGNETAQVISWTAGGASTQHSYITFFEYDYPQEQYPRSGKLSDDEGTAVYTVDKTVDSLVWRMSRSEETYLMDVTYTNTYRGNTGNCRYLVELEKVK